MASDFFARITGSRLGTIALEDSLLPTAFTPAELDGYVSPDALSGGEGEQLHLATRLALAWVLASKSRQLVVLDDVLTASDSARVARALDLLEEITTRLQVLILTCHPERYRGLKKAAFLDLKELRKKV